MNSTPRPRPFLTEVVRSWEEQALFAIELVSQALERLHTERQGTWGFPNEDEINLRLDAHLRRLINQVGVLRGLTNPHFDSPHGRDPSNTGSRTYEKKKPDFFWSFIDPQADNVDRRQKQLVVECKRLGLDVGTWKLNRNYVEKGIARFCQDSHRYAEYSDWAVMIGYVETSDFDTILSEVNAQAQADGFSLLALVDAEWQRIISRLEHRFERPFPVSPFHLRHLWVDLRAASST